MNHGTNTLHRRFARWLCAGLAAITTLTSHGAYTVRFGLTTATNISTFISPVQLFRQMSSDGVNYSGWTWTDVPNWYPAPTGPGHVIDLSVPHLTGSSPSQSYWVRWYFSKGSQPLSPTYVHYATGADGSFYQFPFAAGAGSYSTTNAVANLGNKPMKIRVDYDGDGTWDDEKTIAPGDVADLSTTLTNAPVADGKIEREIYLGDALWAWTEFGDIPVTNWWTPTESPLAVSTNTHAYTPPSIDTVSSNTALQKVQYGPPTTNALDAGTFKTGIESLRNVTLETSDRAAEAVDRLRAWFRGWWGDPADQDTPGEIVDGRESGATTARSAAQGELHGLTNTLISASGTIPGPGSLDPDLFRIPIPGRTNVIDASPIQGVLGDLWAFGRSLILWVLWSVYGLWVLHTAIVAIRAVQGTPQASSSSTVPLYGSAVATAAGVLICATIAGALGVLTVQGLASLGAAITETTTGWQGSEYWTFVVDLADKFVPLTIALGLPSAGLIWYLTANGVAMGVGAFIRAIGV